jgi:hypothetical protein
VYYELDENNIFNNVIEKIDLVIVDISSKLFTTERDRKIFIDRYFNGSFSYDPSGKTVYGRIAVYKKDNRYEIVSDLSNFAHELVHAYQKNMNGLNSKQIFKKSLNLYNSRTDDNIMSKIYYGIYWFNPSEITARINQFYYHLTKKKYNTIEEIYSDEQFKAYTKTCRQIVYSLNKMFDENGEIKSVFKPVVNHIEKELNTKIKTISNIITRGNNVFLTKLYKVCCYYLNDSKMIEEGFRPNDSYLNNIRYIREKTFESF